MLHTHRELPLVQDKAPREQLLDLRKEPYGSRPDKDPSLLLILDQGLQPIWLMDGHKRVLDRDPTILAELTQGTCHSFSRSARHGRHLFVSQQKREPISAAVHLLANLVGKFQQQAAQTGSHCL